MQLTSEQEAIIQAEPSAGNPIKVTAFAGSGKTFTLGEYAKSRPNTRMLYVAYNKSIQLEAEEKMPRNVQARTVHSLAFRDVGVTYKEKLGNLRVGDVMKLLGSREYLPCYFAVETVKKFVASADLEMGVSHVPDGAGKALVQGVAGKKQEKEIEEVRTLLLDQAKDVWWAMCRARKDVNMTHDGYLKLFQMKRPKIPTQLILMDEAQDTTPCVWDLIYQQAARKIVVGDNHQAIYGWRGARDALAQVSTQPELDLSLTTSFRFGPTLAAKASALLQNLKQEERVLRGNPDVQTSVVVDDAGQYADGSLIVCRGNSEVFRIAAKESLSRRIGFIGGAEGYRLQLILDVLYLYEGNKREAKNPLIRAFDTFSDLQDFAEATKDNELLFACREVDKRGPGVREVVDRIRKAEVTPRRAGVVFSTVHKAKGLEWPTVYLGEDLTFPILMNMENPGKYRYTDEEANILYVALTRGMEKVVYSPIIEGFIHSGKRGKKS